MKAEFGERLKRARTRKGLTQKELAAAAGGIDYTYVGKIERGEQLPSLKILERIGEALGVPMVSFFRDEAAVALTDPRLQRLVRTKRGAELLAALQLLREEDVPLLLDLIRAIVRHRGETGEEPIPLAAEEDTPYG